MLSLYDLLEGANGQLFGEPATQLFSDLCFDARLARDASLYVALKTERGDGHQYMREAVDNGATGLLCVTPPGFDTSGLSVILVRDTQAALMSWVRYALHRFGARVIGVAGASGASLAAEAIRAVLATRFSVLHRQTDSAGRLSLPFALAKLTREHQFAILELDADQPGEMEALLEIVRPETAVVTHVGSTQTGGFETPARSAEEHALLVAQLPPDGLAVLNYDDPLVREMAQFTAAHSVTVSLEQFDADLLAYNIVVGLAGTGFDLRAGQNRYAGRWTPLLGKRPLYSLMSALAVGAHYGITLDDGLRALKTITPLPGRMNPLTGLDGALLVDDAYDADPDSTLAALEWLGAVKEERHRAIVVLGDMDSYGTASQRGQRLAGQQAAQVADALVTLGADAAAAGRAALDAGMESRQVQMTYSAPDAVAHLRYVCGLTPDDIVLVKGGKLARMERVVRALLANPADAARLSRHDAPDDGISFAPSARPSWVEVDLDALASNVRGLKALVGERVALMAVVKADAYGSGALAVARTALLNGAEYLGVANLGEALELREAGIEAPILILSYIPPHAMRQAVRYRLTVTLYDLELARIADRAAREMGSRLKVHVKVDTGMGRLGLLPRDAVPFFRHAINLPGLDIEGIYTHFSAADEDPDYTAEQARVFKSVVKPLRASGFDFRYVHAANSAGTLASPDNHFSMVRVGLAMHGLSPSQTVRVPPDFRPVLSWKTVVAQVKTLPPNHPVGYGNTYVTQGEERIAILPVGYADGFRRAPANWGRVLIHGQPAPLVGRVSMEKSAVSIAHIPDVAIGDEVVLLGRQGDSVITADDVAARLGTISYEVLCSILARAPRR